MAHPLSGANIGTLATVTKRAGAPKNLGAGALIALASIGRWPLSQIERLLIESRLPTTDEMPAPVFILGHWRSGTTHLYNIMCKSGAWGYVPPIATGLPWDLFGIAKIFNPLLENALPKHRYIDKIPVKPDSPQEDEIAIANMSPLSFYHGIYFPTAFDDLVSRGLFFDGVSDQEIAQWKARFTYLMRKLYVHQDRKPLLIKNPVYTGRAAMLCELYPNAKFVHIHRNPYDVFVSMQNFYNKLLKEFALQPYDHVDVDETILSVYERMMDVLIAETSGLPASSFVELRYDELDASPMEAVEKVYKALELPGFQAAEPKFNTYLESIQNFEKNRFSYDDATALKVEGRWGRFIDKWNYARPGVR